MTKHAKNNHGMTLVELLVTIALLGIVTTLLVAFLKEFYLHYDRTVYEAHTQLDLRHQTDVLTEEIRSSKIAKIGEEYYPKKGGNKISLFLGTLEDPNIVTYFHNGSVLYRQEGSHSPEVVLKDVAKFQVDVNNHLVKLSISIHRKTDYYDDLVDKEVIIQAKPRATLSNE